MADGTNGAGASYGFGSDRFFGSAGLGFNRFDGGFDGASATQTTFGALFGSQFGGGERSRLAVCPVGQLDWGLGPNVDPVSMHMFSVSAGGRVGIATGDPSAFNVVPTAGLSFVRSSITMSEDLFGLSQTAWESYGVANVGVGLRFNRSRMAVVPSVSFPFNRIGDNNASFGVMFSSNF